MEIVIAANRAGKRAWWCNARRVREADERQRYLIVWHLAAGESSGQVARRLGCARATVLRVAARFRAEGEPGLRDHRRHNGRRAVTDGVMATLARLLAGTPPQWGWARPTLTQDLLLRQLTIERGVTLGRTTLRHQLRRLRARRVRLHFLPPYCPNANRIERVWLDLHAAVTRNHRHTAIADLLAAVDQYLHARSRDTRHARPLHTALKEAA